MIIPIPILREYIRLHRELTFIYSSDYFGASKLGQAQEASGESNTIGIPVRFRFCASNPESYFSDNQFVNLLRPKIDSVVSEALSRNKPIVVFPRIGMGKSEMKWKAPKTFVYMMEELNKIKMKGIEWRFNP